MDKAQVEKIKSMPQFQQLVSERSKFAWSLAAIMFIAYYGFILSIAFNPDFFKTLVVGDVITIGFPIAVGLILLAFTLTAVYVYRANSRFDELTQQVIDEVKS